MNRGQMEIADVLLHLGLDYQVIEVVTCISEKELMHLAEKMKG